MSRNFGIPTWLTRRDDEMDDFPVPPIAALPPPNGGPPLPSTQIADDDHKIFTDAIEAKERALQKVTEYRQREQKLETALQDAIRALKETARDKELQDLRIAQLENNLAVAQSQVETFRQEASDTRALFSSIRAQLDHFEIPLPVRKRVRNGKTNEASHALPEKPIDRPTIQSDQAA